MPPSARERYRPPDGLELEVGSLVELTQVNVPKDCPERQVLMERAEQMPEWRNNPPIERTKKLLDVVELCFLVMEVHERQLRALLKPASKPQLRILPMSA